MPKSTAAATLSSIPCAKNACISRGEALESSWTLRWSAENSSRTVSRTRDRTRGVALELDQEQRAVLEERRVGQGDRSERALALHGLARLVAPDRILEGEAGAAEAAPHDGAEQLLLGAEQLEDVRLGDAGCPGDRLGRRAHEPASRELMVAAAMITSRRSPADMRLERASWVRLGGWLVVGMATT